MAFARGLFPRTLRTLSFLHLSRNKHLFVATRTVDNEYQADALSPYKTALPTGALREEQLRNKERKIAMELRLNRKVKTEPNELALQILQEEILRKDDYFKVSELLSMEDLMAAGVHFGHKRGVWCGAMKPYIFGERDGVHIFNLDETMRHMERAFQVLSHVVYRGGMVLFVNARTQHAYTVQKAARACGEYFVTGRWVGGTMTNSLRTLKSEQRPDLMICLSVEQSYWALAEAAKMGVITIGVCDSDCRPSLVTYPIPGNDDSASAMQLYMRLFSEVILRAKRQQAEDIATFMRTRQAEVTADTEMFEKLAGQCSRKELIKSAQKDFWEINAYYDTISGGGRNNMSGMFSM